jgi:hypothetical protein
VAGRLVCLAGEGAVLGAAWSRGLFGAESAISDRIPGGRATELRLCPSARSLEIVSIEVRRKSRSKVDASRISSYARRFLKKR